MIYTDALEDICNHLLIDHAEGKIPYSELYEDIGAGKFLMAGQLMASSICMNDPAPSFFTPWVYRYFIGGLQHSLQDLPATLPGKEMLSKSYNCVSSCHMLIHFYF